MPSLSDAEMKRERLLMSLSLIQAELVPLQKRTDTLILERKSILRSLHDLGMIPQDIRALTGIPLSTIYAISGRPLDPEEERKRG